MRQSQEALMAAIEAGKGTAKELAQELGNVTEQSIRERLQRLLEDGLLRRTGRATLREPYEYELTETARAVRAAKARAAKAA